MASGVIKKSNMSIQNVTLPFTPPCNGLLLCSIRANTSAGRFYVSFRGTFPTIAEGNAQAGVQNYANAALAVKEGVQVEQVAASNVSSVGYEFVS